MESFRENVREAYRKERLKHRENRYNQTRATLGDSGNDGNISPEDVKQMAIKLKSKHKADLEGLIYLKQAFLQNEENITMFLECKALHLLIKELSGQNESLQLAAANCCCNLSLGNANHCSTLAKTASPYLITHLEGFNIPLIDVCVWTLGNLAGSCLKAWSILHDQGLAAKLTALVSLHTDCIESVIYALTHYVRTGFNKLTPTELHDVAMCTCSLLAKEQSVYWLIYLLSCSPSCDDVFHDNHVVDTALQLLSPAGPILNVQEETALVRVLGNLIGDETGNFTLKLLDNLPQFFPILHSLLTSPHLHLRQEVLWVIGNLINHPCNEVQNRILNCSVQSNLEPHLSLAISLQNTTLTQHH